MNPSISNFLHINHTQHPLPYKMSASAASSTTAAAPSMRGKHWTVEEETTLLEELTAGMAIAEIARKHDRTTGGIDSRRAEIAYKMHINAVPIHQISAQTLLDEAYITDYIRMKDGAAANRPKKAATVATTASSIPGVVTNAVLEKELATVKKELADTKAMVEEILSILKAVYEVSDE